MKIKVTKSLIVVAVLTTCGGLAGTVNLQIQHAQAQNAAAEEKSRLQQIEKLKKAANEVAESYVKGWNGKNTPATAKVSSLYKEVLVEVMDNVLPVFIQKPLSNDGLGRTESFMRDFVSDYYGQFLLSKPDPKQMNDIENREYVSEKIVNRWDKQGKAITIGRWKEALKYRLTILNVAPISEEQRQKIKADVIALPEFVAQEVEKRWPGISQKELNDEKESSRKYGLQLMGDASNPLFKVQFKRENWHLIVDDLLRKDEHTAKIFQEKNPSSVSDAFSALWVAIAVTSSAEVKVPSIDEKDSNALGERVIKYISDLQDLQDRHIHDVATSTSFPRQALTEREVAFWVLNLRNSIDVRN